MAENETQHVEAVAVTPNALEQMERANIDIQIATALAHPRSMAKFYERATAMVTFDETTAASCLYRRPVGKEGGVMKYAEGESVRLAEIVASSYGNIRVAGMIIEMTPRYVKAQGVAHDLETNTAYKAEVVESTVNRHGVPFSERMRVVVAKSAQSKAIRDAIFRIVPKSLCKPLSLKAKEVAKGDLKTFEAKRKAVVAWIKSLNIEPKRVWDAIGIKGEADISVEVLLLLHGLKTAIEEGDCTIDEAFPKPEAEASKGSTAERIKDHFTANNKKVDDKPEKHTDKPTEKPDSKTKAKAAKEKAKLAAADAKAKAKAEKEKAEHPKEPAPEKPPEETKQEEPQETKQESTPEPEPCTHKCLRCDRKLKDNPKDITADGTCAHCFGQIATL